MPDTAVEPQNPPSPSDTAQQHLRILISGASGLIGSHLARRLGESGHDVGRLVRGNPRPDRREIEWHPQTGRLDPAALAGFDAFVHLSGENVAAGRWTPAVKQRIRDSRVETTRLLARTITQLQPRPRLLIAASAIGYYGSRGDEMLTEESPPGQGFLASVCQEWEAAAEPARAAGIRVVHLRLGVVLTPAGGALAKMLTPFRMGVGGVVGSGGQWISWIGLSDVMRVFEFVLASNLAGPVNAVSPQPVTNREFTKTLGAVLHRPTLLRIPARGLKLALGQMADETLLASARVYPARLQAAGFTFEHPRLEQALRHEFNPKSQI